MITRVIVIAVESDGSIRPFFEGVEGFTYQGWRHFFACGIGSFADGDLIRIVPGLRQFVVCTDTRALQFGCRLEIANMFDDLTARYAPDALLSGKTCRQHLVSRFIVHPRGSHPATCPLVADCVALECQLAVGVGSRWFGCQSAYINSELRMVVIGCDSRDEVRMTWKPVQES